MAELPRTKIDPKEWENMGSGYKTVSVTVYLPKTIRDEMKYKDMIAFQVFAQDQARKILGDEIEGVKARVQQMLEATLKDARVEVEIRGI